MLEWYAVIDNTQFTDVVTYWWRSYISGSQARAESGLLQMLLLGIRCDDPLAQRILELIPELILQGSVEDVQWSPAEASVLASCSTDHNICIWDARVGQTKPGAKILAAHDADVNVLSWNRLVNYLLVSGVIRCCESVSYEM